MKKKNVIQLNLVDMPKKKPVDPDDQKQATVTPVSFSVHLKVNLLFNKRIYRTIEAYSGNTLEAIHNSIFRAFNRFENHMYSFYFPDKPLKKPHHIRKSTEYACKEFKDDGFSRKKIFKANKTTLRDLKLQQKQKFYYLFDYGDEWWHEIEVESITEDLVLNATPKIIKSAGNSPSQYPDDEVYDDIN